MTRMSKFKGEYAFKQMLTALIGGLGVGYLIRTSFSNGVNYGAASVGEDLEKLIEDAKKEESK